MSQRKPLCIPPINNHLEALAIHLGINSSVDTELVKIQQLDASETIVNGMRTQASYDVKHFLHDGVRYRVAHANSDLRSDHTVAFNSNRWAIQSGANTAHCEAPASFLN